ncbi:MAG TPA: glycosyltransferase family 39 protein [Vicinamibacterales bacterium]|nr:glycosyltransferase family 39 protein [Vicinamibacterales bacterium]
MVRRAALAFGAYALLVLAAAWPLTGQLRATLPGHPSGDTGVYVWNLWVFRHELIGHGVSPLSTDHVFAGGRRVDLALHNYTIFQDVIALPLVPAFGLVAAFNVTWLFMQALSGFGVFLLARRVTDRDAVAWLAGALFACSPTMIARSTAHQSLVAAAPLAFFLWFVLRTADRRSLGDAVLAGVCAAWAAICDAYYGLYCVPLLGCVLAARLLRWEKRGQSPSLRYLGLMVTVPAVLVAAVIVFIVLTGGTEVALFGRTIGLRSLYTPVLVLTVLAAIRGWLALGRRGRLVLERPADRLPLVQLGAGVFACALFLSPLLVAAAGRLQAGGRLQETVYWRSSPAGADLLAFFLPNPFHPLAPAAIRDFLTTRPDALPENVVSVPWVAIVVIALACFRRLRPPTVFVIATVCFALLALGPFVTVAQVNTHVPAPWAFLRYVPILGAARSPTRFAIPMLIGVSVLFAWALDRVGRRGLAVGVAAAALAFELLPVPRPLASAEVSPVYAAVRADPRDVTVLEVPFGMRDGTGGIGRMDTGILVSQTVHEKRLMNGYISRVPRQVYRRVLADPVLEVFTSLSEGRVLPQVRLQGLDAEWTALVQRSTIGYVVVDESLSPAPLLDFVRTLPLTRVTAAGTKVVYATSLSTSE